MSKLARNQNRDTSRPTPPNWRFVKQPVTPEAAKILKISDKQYDRLRIGARNWAAAQPSDPFALNVALSHVKNGISSYFMTEKNELREGFYDAKMSMEERTLHRDDGSSEKYNVTIFVDLRRV